MSERSHPTDWKLSAKWAPGTLTCRESDGVHLCTRPMDHAGPHMAGAGDVLITQWFRAPSRGSAP